MTKYFQSILLLLIISRSLLFATDIDYKAQAIEEFKNANYPKAIELLEEAKKTNPNDPEIYYYLGYFTHYLCYDSVPTTGFNQDKSDEVMQYLFKAIELNPTYGDAYYFIGAEYGVRARSFLNNGSIKKARKEYILAKEKGGLPDWLIEYGKNMLQACEPNAILITGGDADFNPIQYLQIVENYRKDVTVIPYALLERPWFLNLIKQGVPKGITPAPISWSEEQIFSAHPYKWKENTVIIPIPQRLKEKYEINDVFNLLIKPDLKRGSKELLSVNCAVIVDIIKTNNWERPFYFSVGCAPYMYFGLRENFQICGIVNKLLPFKVKNTKWEYDIETIETVLLNKENYEKLSTILDSDMPRISNILINYRASAFQLAAYYFYNDNKIKAKEVCNFITSTFKEEYIPLGSSREMFYRFMENLE